MAKIELDFVNKTTEEIMLDIGTKVLDFKLKNQDDKDVSITDYKEKWVVLYFYPKDNTSG
jgi:thioredoxin-dependent peroxiredoxin